MSYILSSLNKLEKKLFKEDLNDGIKITEYLFYKRKKCNLCLLAGFCYFPCRLHEKRNNFKNMAS